MITDCASTKSVSLNATIVMDRYVSISDAILRHSPMRYVDAMVPTTKWMVAPFDGGRKGTTENLHRSHIGTVEKTPKRILPGRFRPGSQ